MVTLSKPISAGQAQTYHKEEFANAKENYYTEGERVRGEWQGQLAARWGLRGEVQEQQFARLAEGRHPETGEQLVRHQTAREYVIPLPVEDAARLHALAELFPGQSLEDLLTDLLHAGLDEIAAAMPYERGPKVISRDDQGDPVYEDVGLTPRFGELTRRHKRNLKT